MSQKRDYYEVLGVDRGADAAQLKKSYRQAALKYHPDRNPGDAKAEEMFKEVSEAYEVLSDDQKRQVYDRFGHDGLSGQGFAQRDPGDVFSSFSSLFEDFFGFSGGGGSSRGRDLAYELELSFEEAMSGTEKTIQFQRPTSCEPCHGTGSKTRERVTCQMCQGHGQVRRNQGFFSVATTCPTCRGAGNQVKNACHKCKGQGVVQGERELKVKVPAGVDNGQKLRVSGEGEAGDDGGRPGDLYVVLNIAESKYFERHDSHLIYRQPIGVAQASLGCQVEVPTLEGKKMIDVVAGTQHEDRMVLKGEGVPRLRGGTRGDLYIEFQVKIPEKLTNEQRELLQKFAESRGEAIKPCKKTEGSFFQRIFE
ncbi:MAG: molecular chaperone DnaJ [Oligoflexales bacterium]